MNRLVNLDFSQVAQNLLSETLWVVIKIVIALVIYYIGRWLMRRLVRLIDVAMEHRKVELSLRAFTRSSVRAVFMLLLILIVVSTLGVNVTSLIAVASAATLAIGMALSGTAQNFAGGVMILLMKPYRVGDYISAQGESGTVREIKLFSTVITTNDNQTIYIPNQLDRHGHHRQLFDSPRTTGRLDGRDLLRRRRRRGPGGDSGDVCRRRTDSSAAGTGRRCRGTGRQFGESEDPGVDGECQLLDCLLRI